MFKYLIVAIISKLIWLFPYPTKPRLIKIGNPTADSPVLVTCNFARTVEILKRVLRERDLYLLVAHSKGINVWCAAGGGHFTHHSIISIIKTSGIEGLVNHKKIILPQLGAPGIETRVLKERTGWKGIWGPVRADDIPAFIDNGMKKTEEMRTVEFPFVDRFGVAVGWVLPFSIIALIIAFFINKAYALPIFSLMWISSFVVFLSFPLYEGLLIAPLRRFGPIEYNFEFGGIQLTFWVLITAGILLFTALVGSADVIIWGFVIRWGLITLVIVLFLSTELAGATPIYKSPSHEERTFAVKLDEEKCKGTGICIDVCPRNCFELDKKRHKVAMPGAALCEKCAACIVQCPVDALFFASDDGKMVLPETTRKYKLNLMGKRSVST
jgi:ferredoxin